MDENIVNSEDITTTNANAANKTIDQNKEAHLLENKLDSEGVNRVLTQEQASKDCEQHTRLSRNENCDVSSNMFYHRGSVRRQGAAGHIMFLVAMATMCQGLGFFAASRFGESVPFLPRDPIVLIGMMYTVMGLGFLAISWFCHHSNTQRGEKNCTCSQTVGKDDSSMILEDLQKKTN